MNNNPTKKPYIPFLLFAERAKLSRWNKLEPTQLRNREREKQQFKKPKNEASSSENRISEGRIYLPIKAGEAF